MERNESVAGLLGELEGAVMNVVWSLGEVRVRQVHEALRPERDLAYTTVMTVMSRLAEKGVLERERRGRAYVYRAAQTGREGFLRRQAHTRVRALLDQFGDLAVAAFVGELSEGDAERLAELVERLAEAVEADDVQDKDDAQA